MKRFLPILFVAVLVGCQGFIAPQTTPQKIAATEIAFEGVVNSLADMKMAGVIETGSDTDLYIGDSIHATDACLASASAAAQLGIEDDALFWLTCASEGLDALNRRLIELQRQENAQ